MTLERKLDLVKPSSFECLCVCFETSFIREEENKRKFSLALCIRPEYCSLCIHGILYVTKHFSMFAQYLCYVCIAFHYACMVCFCVGSLFRYVCIVFLYVG